LDSPLVLLSLAAGLRESVAGTGTASGRCARSRSKKPPGRKPGPRATKEWQLFVAMKWCTEKYSGKSSSTAGEFAKLCQEEFGYLPAETAINKLLRDLLRLLG
jgi:hypothetical protein